MYVCMGSLISGRLGPPHKWPTVCMYVCMYVCMCCACGSLVTCMVVHMHVCVYVHVHMYVCMYVHAYSYICMFACMYMYICQQLTCITGCIACNYACMYVRLCICMHHCVARFSMYVYACA